MVKVTRKNSLSEERKADITKRVLKKINIQEEESAASKLASENNLPYMDLNLFPISGDDLRLLSEKDSQKLKIVIFSRKGNEVKIGTPDPSNEEALEYVKEFGENNGFNMSLYVISDSSLEKAWKKYKNTPFLENIDMLKMSLSKGDLKDFEKEFKDLIELKKRIKEVSTTQIVNIVIAGAIKMKASDIHLEPQEKDARLRYRIDGVLQDIGNLPPESFRFILSRIKMMGKMKINVKSIAQDGHFSINIGEERVDVRVSTIPGKHGEVVVMRLLNQASILLKIEDLGLKGLAYEQVKKQVERPNGMILTTGPTGSGKTTTLYALINKLNTPDIKIITIEDPIEYQIKDITQTQVSKDKKYTFSEGLRAIVRQDPDVILVGEIRDEETADIAVNAALTGHLVLSTLHTNNAAATIPRLLELSIKPNLITPAINALIAQRLVRRLCSYCREKYVPATESVDSIKKLLAVISPKAKINIPKEIKHLYRPKGCSRCHGLGYKGRIGIFEVLTISEKIEELVLDLAGENEITQEALEEGMVTMTQDGILKAIEGVTSIEEVQRVAGQTEFLEEVYKKLMDQTLSYAIHVKDVDLKETESHINSFDDLSKFINSTNQKDAFKYVLTSALFLGAGDIHIEPEEKDVKIRFRIDGILQTIGTIPINEYPTFLGEIKVLSGFKAEAREGVKDSRFAIELESLYDGKFKDTKIDVRVSIILGGFGETVVLRLLNKSAVALEIEKLGIRKQNLEKILNEISKPNGIFLNTGPTGSGKTTTLYSLLGKLNDPEVKIITVEDPIEYQLEGILQTQVNNKDGYDFAKALRSLLRQNPDIMMIGEIRDEETAKIAVQSALTGHFVLSTIHTNDACGSVQRLINMGVRPDDLAISINAFMAQRLVRKLCDCKEKVKPTKEEKEKIAEILKSISKKAGVEIPKTFSLYKPKGCKKCNRIGYKGRTVISEVMVADEDLKELISNNVLAIDIKKKAIENGMITMRQDGTLKAIEGETTFEEIERSTRE